MAQRIIQKGDYQYDVFVSHASEDKAEVARPLAVRLQELGLRVWYDEFELSIGDNLVAKLNAGIGGSRFGILVLSKNFFGKEWTEYELDSLEYLAVTEDRVLFPIWHNVSEADVRAYRPSLARILAWRTVAKSVEQIAGEIYQIVMDLYRQEQSTRKLDE